MKKTLVDTPSSGPSAHERMVVAAAKLLIDQGPDAITHRRVAEAANIPLGSANYFFPTRRELYAFAVEAAEATRLEAAQQIADELATASRSAIETARLLIQTWYAPHVDRDVVRARLEPMIDALHDPELSAVMAASRPRLLDVLTQVLEKSGFIGVTDVNLVALVLDGSLLYERVLDDLDPLQNAERQVARQLILIAGRE